MRLALTSQIEAEQARRSLPAFVRAAWPVVERSPLVWGFHVDAICESLDAVARGESRRLMINLPPRHLKSTLVSVLFPAWLWITYPHLRLLCASYGIDLSTRDNLRARRLVESAWYQERYGRRVRLASDQNRKTRFETDEGGARYATSVGGAATGEGGDLLILDDPHKVDEASSAAARETALEWYDTVFATRLNDPATGSIIVIGQRVHEHDLFGHLLEIGGFDHVCLPAEFDPTHPFLWPNDPRTQEGELLCPERFGPNEIADLKRHLGSYGTACQLQQLPAPAHGGIFQRHWWNWYDPNEKLPAFDEILQSWDLTFTGNPSSDFVVGQVWAVAGPNKYLLQQVREQLGFTETLDAIRALTVTVNSTHPRHANHAVIIEKAANADAILDVLRHEIPSLILVKPVGDKIGRAHAVSPQAEGGNVFLPGHPNSHHTSYDPGRTPAWVQAFVEEAATFPNGRYDDQVDCFTQALLRANNHGPRARWIYPQRPLPTSSKW